MENSPKILLFGEGDVFFFGEGLIKSSNFRVSKVERFVWFKLLRIETIELSSYAKHQLEGSMLNSRGVDTRINMIYYCICIHMGIS